MPINRTWTERQDNALITAYNAFESYASMAIRLGRSVAGVKQRVRRLMERGRIQCHGGFNQAWTPAEDAHVIRRRKELATKHAIAEELHRSVQGVHRRCMILIAQGLLPRLPGGRPRSDGDAPHRRGHEEHLMPDLPDEDGPSYCSTCRSSIYDGFDRMGYATVTCRCGTRYVERRVGAA